MKTLLLHCLTGIDGETYDIARVACFLGVIVFLGLAIVNWRHFGAQDFGIGFGALVAGGGAACGMKAGTEPPASPPPP